MRLASIRIRNVRALAEVDVEPGPRINVLAGPNGSGKTSFLEAVHLLSLGRSFRTRRARAVIRHGVDSLTVSGRVLPGGEAEDGDGDGAETRIGIERGATRARFRVDGEEVRSVSSLARRLPAMVIAPEGLKALLEGSEHRRRLLDWTLFHVEPNYLGVLQRYGHVLRQRNALLREPPRAGVGQELDAWEEQLADSGERLDSMRRFHMESDTMRGTVSRMTEELLSEPVTWEYRSGWERGADLRELLASQRARDRQAGFTTAGPHRADLVWRRDPSGGLARDSLSRGQGRLLVMAFEMAQAAYVVESADTRPVLLVDDLSTELDVENMQRLLSRIAALGLQVFISSVLEELTTLVRSSGAARLFHVKQGEVHAG